MEKIFPSGIAEGSAFCNRSVEKQRIIYNLKNTVHTLLLSPRRYGKTSLILETLSEEKIPYASIQFFNAFRDDIVLKRFVKGINGLLSKLISPGKFALKKFGQMLTHGQLVIKTKGLDIQFGVEPTAKNPIDVIQGLLEDIENILKNKKKSAVIFLDEFQDIIFSDISNELQSILRDFIQKTKHITFIISGSHRHMLLKLFDDRNKPFYKLFDRLLLKRIEAEEYRAFMQEKALSKWKKKIADDVIREIITTTECHAYYFNRLCHKLWTLPRPPQLNDVHEAWSQLTEEEFSTIASELSSLSKNQRLVLQSISKFKTVKEPTGIEFLNDVKLNHRSVLLAIEALAKADFVESTEEGYRVVDPVVKYILLS